MIEKQKTETIVRLKRDFTVIDSRTWLKTCDKYFLKSLI